jgi:hypothetical protein
LRITEGGISQPAITIERLRVTELHSIGAMRSIFDSHARFNPLFGREKVEKFSMQVEV